MVLLFVVVATLVIAAISVITMVRREKRLRDERLEERPPFPLIYPVGPAAPASVPRSASRPVRPVPDVEVAIAPEEEPDLSSTVLFRRPVEQAVQLLPGRLEVLAGERRHKEIRLLRVPGESAQVILGRERIDAPGHVALQSSTVSRRHARLAYADGVWKVANLSRTNPVVVNDEALSADHERPLADGDRLELGEVVLRFRAR